MGERLQYRLVEGCGPETGWVSKRLGGRELLQRLPEDSRVACEDFRALIRLVDLTFALRCAASSWKDRADQIELMLGITTRLDEIASDEHEPEILRAVAREK